MAAPPAKRPRRPPYDQIHSRPLPIETYPLPAFQPANPLSLFRLACAVVSTLIKSSEQTSRPDQLLRGTFSPPSRSVNVTDQAMIRKLWEHGFFGSGNLSRSEPQWVLDECKRRQMKKSPGTFNDTTRKRRDERRGMKLERARAQAEAIQEQLRKEGKLPEMSEIQSRSQPRSSNELRPAVHEATGSWADHLKGPDRSRSDADVSPKEGKEDAIQDIEHLQLMPEEAFFLSFGLGMLEIVTEEDPLQPLQNLQLLRLFSNLSTLPPNAGPLTTIRVDNIFLIRYVVYHHFRSLGWVVRSGIKFATDLLLYYRGPVFAHAEFAVNIVPVRQAAIGDESLGPEGQDWWRLYCTNRVQSRVFKNLILVYVEVPAQSEIACLERGDIASLLRQYTVREMSLKRWTPNRARD